MSTTDAGSRWYENGVGPPIKNLGIVFGECGKSQEFVHHGMIASARAYLGNIKLASNVVLVLCGAGLESIHLGGHGLTKTKYIGSDPRLSKLLIIEKNDLEKLQDIGLRNAIKECTYSSVLGTNA